MFWELVREALIQYFPQIGGYTALIFIVGIFVYYFTKFYLETKKTNKSLPNIEATLTRIDKGFSTLNQVLLETNIISNSCYSVSNSPRVLNEAGKKLYQQSGAETLFERLKNELLKALEEKHLDSLLELEKESLNVLLSRMNGVEFKDVQSFAFQHPTFEENNLNYTDILFVMSIKLRDFYREKYPELK